MFKNLRNRLIIINVTITTVVLLVVFSAIYIIYTRSANNRPPMMAETHYIFSDDVEDYVEISLKQEKETAARELLVMLVVSGFVIDFVVALVSYYLAEEAIKPVKEAYESQKLFIANASHEIKTPLAAISANLEAADIHGNKWIKNVETETAKLTKLNADLLNLARTDINPSVDAADVNLGELVRETTESFESRMKDKDFSLRIMLHGKTKVNREDFVQILTILLDNAVKYSEDKIRVSLSNHELKVSNDGAKIDAKDLPHIFDRFFQSDKSAEGVGLGLSIAKSLADRNGWKIEVKSGKLTTFILSF